MYLQFRSETCTAATRPWGIHRCHYYRSGWLAHGI